MNTLMEVKRTVFVKLDVPDERCDDLRTTIKQFNGAANYPIANGRNDDGPLMQNVADFERFDGVEVDQYRSPK